MAPVIPVLYLYNVVSGGPYDPILYFILCGRCLRGPVIP
jgi:hypothetical protein